MITHKGTQTLTTPRLTLRRFTPADAPAMYQNWASDPEVPLYVAWDPHPSPEFTAQLLENWCASYENEANYNWVMELNGTPIGSINVVNANSKHEYAELGYCMGRPWWGQGLMTEAARAVVDYLFGEIGFHRIIISHAAKNPASGRVAQKCGFTYEGTRREHFKKPSTGEFHNVVDYALLKSEWETMKKDK